MLSANNKTTINHGLRANALLTSKALVATPWYLLTTVINGSATVLRGFEGGRALEETTWLEIAKCEGRFGDWFSSFLTNAIESLVASMTYSVNSLTSQEQLIADSVAKARSGGDSSLEKTLSKKIRMSLHREKRKAIAEGRKLSKASAKTVVQDAIDDAIAAWSTVQP